MHWEDIHVSEGRNNPHPQIQGPFISLKSLRPEACWVSFERWRISCCIWLLLKPKNKQTKKKEQHHIVGLFGFWRKHTTHLGMLLQNLFNKWSPKLLNKLVSQGSRERENSASCMLLIHLSYWNKFVFWGDHKDIIASKSSYFIKYGNFLGICVYI